MNLDLKFYWGLFVKRLPVMLALFLVCSISATVSALKLPPTYSTSATLLVEEAQIPNSMMRVDQIDAGQQLQVIQQRLLTRANLLEIARKFEVFEDIRTMTPDAIVKDMNTQTRIRLTGGRGEATLMNVSFEARHPETASNVVNEYVTLILQESTDFRMRRAENTLSFFEQEVGRLSDDLALQSAQIVEFKNTNASALPSDLTYRLNRQTLLQERQARLEREVASLEKQREDMVRIFETTGRVDSPDAASLSPQEAQLAQMESDLQQALAVYSNTNPRVILLQNRIAQLRKTLEEEAALRNAGEDTNEARPASMFELTLADMDQRTVNLRQELATVARELDSLTQSIQATAGNAISLSALERDFENIQIRYNEAVQNLNQARVNERIEVSAQGQRITVLENASVPQEPSGPKRFRLIALGVLAGGGLAVGFFLLLELFNRTIRRPAELTSKFGILPLAVIPYMESPREKAIRHSVLIGAFLAVMIGVPAILWYIDTQYMPLDILANKVFDRLGLT